MKYLSSPHMNVERFIASRIAGGRRSFSGLIIRIAIAAVALSMMVMIITTNVITGFKNEISHKVFSFWGHIHITDYGASESFELIPLRKDDKLINELRDIKQLDFQPPPSLSDNEPPRASAEHGVAYVDPYIIVPSILRSKRQFEMLFLKGVGPDYNFNRLDNALREGTFIQYSDTTASRDLLVSQHTADRMNFSIGQKVNVNFILDGDTYKRQFTICGIYKTGLAEYDKRFGMVDIRMLQELLKWTKDQVLGIEISVHDLEELDAINDYIYYELLPPATTSETVKTKFYQLFEWLELQNINERFITTLMLLVALINMITGILIFVLERNQMIGILKSLGSTNWMIRKIFIYNAARIIIYGAAIGNAISIAFCWIQKKTHLLKLDEENYYLDHVPIEFNLWSMLLLNLGTITIITLCMLVPTLVISKIHPVKVLRFD